MDDMRTRRHSRAALAGALLGLLLATAASAQAPPDDDVPAPLATGPEADGSDIVDLETLVVSGAQPGPGLWRVSSAEGNVLWILGTVSPLPGRMQWMSSEVEDTIARAQAVIDPPRAAIRSDAGRFRNLLLLPSLLRARRNPEGRSLQQSVPAEAYARWLPLKARYLGDNRAVERWRPIFAALELYRAAIRASGLTLDSATAPVIERAAGRHGVPRVEVRVTVTIDNPRQALREFRSGALEDTDCFVRMLSSIEGDLDAMRQRANAWAVGDLDALRAARHEGQYEACERAVTETGLARRLGLDDVARQLGDAWVEAADTALRTHAESFASLSVATLLRPDGVLARLQARGYRVEAPDGPGRFDEGEPPNETRPPDESEPAPDTD